MIAVPCYLSWKPSASSTSPPSVPTGHLSPTGRLGNPQPHYHRNQQYSIVALTNAAGTLVERYTYSAYGTLGIYDPAGTVRSSSPYANRYTYTGREYDPDLNLYHFRARWYDPATGGFITRDPLGYVDGMSLYRGYFAVHELDPYGTISRTNFKPILTGDPCDGGSIGHSWDWKLDGFLDRYGKRYPGHQHGWIIQRIEIRCIRCKCDNCRGCVGCTSSDPVVYFEAWHFGEFKIRKESGGRTKDRITNAGSDYHSSWGTIGEKGCFRRSVKAEVRFLTTKDPYRKDSFPLIDDDPRWQARDLIPFFHNNRNNDCATTAGGLHTYLSLDPAEIPRQWAEAGFPIYVKEEKSLSYEYETELNCCIPDLFTFTGKGDFPEDVDFPPVQIQ